MKSTTKTLLFLSCALLAHRGSAQVPAASPEQVRATDLLDKMVGKFHAFLSRPQKLVYKQKSDEVASKSVFILREFTTREVSSDMKNNDSLNVPFNGYVQFTLGAVNDSVKCGAVAMKSGSIKGSATSGDAVKFSDKADCFAPAAGITLPLEIHVNFAYQRGKWVAKSVTQADGKRDAVLTATLLGSAMDNIDVVEDGEGAGFNGGWKALMTGNS